MIINDLPILSSPASGDELPIERGTNTYKIDYNALATAINRALIPSTGNAGFHNSIFRGKYLGSSLTADQSDQIQAGTFDDLFIGDYWTINDVDWVIVDFDPCYRCGDTISLGHHIGVMPRVSLNDAQWNTTDSTSTGYVNSAIRANIKDSGGAEEKVIAAFGSTHVLSYRALYPSRYSSGKAAGWAWADARVELVNETQLYGHQIWGQNGFEDGNDKRQLSIFHLDPAFTNIGSAWWLRSVYSTTNACDVGSKGAAGSNNASASHGVRPFALIA